MEPLFDQNSEGRCDECNEETQDPEGIDNGGNSRCLKRRDIESWNGRVDKVSVDRQVGCLIDELHEEEVGEIFGLLSEVLVRLDNECGDDRRE